MTNEIIKQGIQLTASYTSKFNETPIAKSLIESGKKDIYDQIMAAFYFVCRKNPQDVKKWSQTSVVEALTKACQWRLIPDGELAALIPYGSEIKFQPMFKGLLEVAYRTGVFKNIAAEVVYDGDDFKYSLGAMSFVEHQKNLRGKRIEPIAVYADALLTTGGRLTIVMTMDEVNYIESKAKNKTVWKEWKDAMRRKTAIKQLAKIAPKSEELQQLVAYDNALEQDFDRLPDNTKANALNALLGNAAAPEQLLEPTDADLDNEINDEVQKEIETKS